MKILKYVAFALGGLIAVVLLAGLFISKDVKYEKSIVINAPVDSVWMHVSSLAEMDKWSPWVEKDPQMKKTLTGVDGTVGAMSAWESDNEEVGKGSQTISRLEAPTRCETQLKFYMPYESEAMAYVVLAPEGDGTKATWGFKSQMPYPFNVSRIFIDMESMMDGDWNKGLGKLKALSEK